MKDFKQHSYSGNMWCIFFYRQGDTEWYQLHTEDAQLVVFYSWMEAAKQAETMRQVGEAEDTRIVMVSVKVGGSDS